jgi:hypothetical protein
VIEGRNDAFKELVVHRVLDTILAIRSVVPTLGGSMLEDEFHISVALQ